jgi:hypothetical protein
VKLVVELHRDQGSRSGRLIYRDSDLAHADIDGALCEGPERPWSEVLAEARKLAGAGSTVRVRVFGRSQWYGTGYRQQTTYMVQLPRQRGGGS